MSDPSFVVLEVEEPGLSEKAAAVRLADFAAVVRSIVVVVVAELGSSAEALAEGTRCIAVVMEDY